MKLEFFGAAAEVTGSCHILHVDGKKVLLDCGLIQGSRKDEERNRDPFPFEASTIDASLALIPWFPRSFSQHQYHRTWHGFMRAKSR